LQPFIDHPTDDTIRDSSVKKGAQVGVRNRPKIVLDVEIYHPTQSVAHEAVTQRSQGLMSRATRPEPVGARKKVVLVYGFQYHAALCGAGLYPRPQAKSRQYDR